MSVINWSDSNCKVSEHFTVRECLWLPQWNRMATEADGLTNDVKANLFRLCNKMDVVREQLGASVTVHCCFRPTEYNKLVGGAAHSSHMTGEAIDFDVQHLNCDDARNLILKLHLLDTLEMRMEDLPHSSWVHLDIGKVGASGHRFFKP